MVITWPASRHSTPTTASRPTCMRGWLTTWKRGSTLETSYQAPGCPASVTWPLNTRSLSGRRGVPWRNYVGAGSPSHCPPREPSLRASASRPADPHAVPHGIWLAQRLGRIRAGMERGAGNPGPRGRRQHRRGHGVLERARPMGSVIDATDGPGQVIASALRVFVEHAQPERAIPAATAARAVANRRPRLPPAALTRPHLNAPRGPPRRHPVRLKRCDRAKPPWP
jgi:hypothetical protein